MTRDKTAAEGTPLPLPEQPPHTSEYWAQAAMVQAKNGTAAALEHLAAVKKHLADQDAAKALASAEQADTAVRGVGHSVAAVLDHWVRLQARIVRHPVVSSTVAVFVLAGAGWLLWPAASVPANVPAVRKEPVEMRVTRLIQAGRFNEASDLIDREMNTPRGWHLRGEIETLRGNKPAARLWHKRAAAAGDRGAKIALGAMDHN